MEKQNIISALVLANSLNTAHFLNMLSMSSAESQKGAIADQRCSVENQKGAIAIDFVQR